jgi:hypothetical protein
MRADYIYVHRHAQAKAALARCPASLSCSSVAARSSRAASNSSVSPSRSSPRNGAINPTSTIVTLAQPRGFTHETVECITTRSGHARKKRLFFGCVCTVCIRFLCLYVDVFPTSACVRIWDLMMLDGCGGTKTQTQRLAHRV